MSNHSQSSPLTPDSVFAALVAIHREQQSAPPAASPAASPVVPLLRLLDKLRASQPPAGEPAAASPPAPGADVIELPPRQPRPDSGPVPGAGAAATDGDAPPSVFARLRTMLDEYDELVRRYHADFDELHARHAPVGPGPETDDEQLLERMRQAQRILLKYPIAAQAAVAALVAEGRRFAGTPEGSRWKQALVDSPLVSRGRAVWDATALRSFATPPSSEPARALPGGFVEAFLRASTRADLEPLLAQLFAGRGGGDNAG